MFRSATFKLTMWYLAIVMTISVIFSVVLYHVTTAELANGLHRETQRIYTQFPVFQGNPLLRSGTDYATSAHRILLRLIGFNVIVLAGAGLASYWLARRTLEPIEAAHEQQKRFTADVSHELRTPLTALKMESEVALMHKQSTAKELRAALSSNLEEAAKLENLINNLLRLTRLEADELQQNFAVLEISDAVQGAIEQITKAAHAKHITLDNQVTAAQVSGDPDALAQLLFILLDNAVKYSSEGSTVTLSSRQEAEQVILSVKDQGSGIEKEALEHVFDRFYRADNSRGGDSEGFGLGLSIAKMIADVHQGSVTLSSRPGHGTTATVSLPAEES